MYDQQGDVLLKKIDKLPSGIKFKKTKSNQVVLAEGELTGHSHMLVSPLSPINIYEKNGETWIEVLTPSDLNHQEHDLEKIDPGIYKIEIVKEYDYFEERARRVVD